MRSERMIALLERWVNMETPSGDHARLTAMALDVADTLKELGANIQMLARPNGDCVRAEMGSGARQILLLGHMDTVFPVGEAEPFKRENGMLYGAGALDMKAGLVMITEIFRYFSGKLPEEWKLTALINADEEIGSRDTREDIQALAQCAEACLCFEPASPGYCTISRKGIAAYNVEFFGRAAHSGTNAALGVSAIRALARWTEHAYALYDEQEDVSINIGAVDGGGKLNVVPDRASAKGEARAFDPARLMRTIKALEVLAKDSFPGVRAEFTYRIGRPPMVKTEKSLKLYEIAKAHAHKYGLELNGRDHGGGSDGSFASEAGAPVLDGIGGEGSFAHSRREYVLESSFEKRLMMSIDTLETLMHERF